MARLTKYIKTMEALIEYSVKYVLAEIEENPRLSSREIGGILRREFGISGCEYIDTKKEVFSKINQECNVVETGGENFYYRKGRKVTDL